VSLVAEVAVVSTLAFHWRGVGVGLAEEEVRLAPVEVALHFPVLASRLGDPVAPGGVGGDELLVVGVWLVIEVSVGCSRCTVRVARAGSCESSSKRDPADVVPPRSGA
jgi:hypothetical protein